MLLRKFFTQEECTQILASIGESYRVQNRWCCENFMLPDTVKQKLRNTLKDRPSYSIQIYNKEDSFDPHIDFTGTKHRTQSMTVVLNNGFKGGKFFCDSQKYYLDTGDAVIFGVTDLHWVTPVTDGRRYSLAVWGVK